MRRTQYRGKRCCFQRAIWGERVVAFGSLVRGDLFHTRSDVDLF
ncbi:MAG: nucleotidyltransferase domain-containing protein [Desulfobacterales bacterium]|nr:nucleotidyltransferase domain-containing protein [Desulfobacterales bacterium]